MANGDFAGDYKLTGTFPSAGEGLHPGSAVVFRGVQVGRVSTVNLYENQAKVTLLIEPSFKVPATPPPPSSRSTCSAPSRCRSPRPTTTPTPAPT